MGKIDPKHDYYADLEIAPDASSEDIKKQFRKLALKYHPDRNPGQEVEVIAKFQAIQAAHEALEDPDKRAAYDEDRKKAALRNNFARPPSAARRGNPYTVNTDFPPPPSRTRPRNPSDVPPPPPGGGGAARYSQFPGPSSQKQRERPRTWQEAQAKNNIFSTYQNMSSGSKAQAPRQPYPVPPPYQSSSQRPPPRSPFQRRPSDTSPQRSAYEETHRPPQPGITRTHSTRVPRGAAFDMDDGYSDSSAKFDRSNPPRMPNGFSQRPPAMPPRAQAPTAKRPEHPRSFRTNSGDEIPYTEGSGRESTPYMSHPNDRTYFDSDALRRSVPTSPQQPRRHRSLSPISRTSSLNAEPTSAPNNAAHHGRHNSQQGVRQNVPPRPYATYSPDNSSESDDTPDQSPNDTANGDIPGRPKAKPSASWINRSGTGKHGSLEEQSNAEAGQAAGPRSPHGSMFDFPAQNERSTASPDPQRPRSMEDMSRKFATEPENTTNDSGSTEKMYRTESHPDLTSLRGQASHRPFIPPQMRSKLSGSDMSAQFQPPPRSAPADSEPLATDGLPKPPKSAGDQPENEFAPAPQASHYFDDAAHHGPRNDSFSAEEWSEELKNGNWAENWARDTSPTKSASQGARRSRTTSRNSRTGNRPPTVPKAVSVSDDIDEDYEPNAVRKDSANGETHEIDDNAMDIDERSPPAAPNGPKIVIQEPLTSGVRHVYVEPQRRDWQNHITPAEGAPVPPGPSTRPMPPSAPPSNSNFGMKDFRNVAPFNTEDTGLRSFSDMSSALPFTSQAATSAPMSPQSPMSPQNSILLRLPRPPILPKDPERLTIASWETHLQHMRAYMTAWNTFNRRIVDLLALQAAKYCNMESGARGGMVDGWLSAVGGTRELGGWDAYTKALDEDRRVREYWGVACEKHADVVARHGRLRDRVLRGDVAAG